MIPVFNHLDEVSFTLTVDEKPRYEAFYEASHLPTSSKLLAVGITTGFHIRILSKEDFEGASPVGEGFLLSY